MSIDQYVAALREYTTNKKAVDELYAALTAAAAEVGTYRNGFNYDVNYMKNRSQNPSAKLPATDAWFNANEISDFVQKFEASAKLVSVAYKSLTREDQQVVARPT